MAKTFPMILLRRFVIDPFHFWTDKLKSRNAVIVDGIILIFKSEPGIQRNICFGEMFMITESITGKKIFVGFCMLMHNNDFEKKSESFHQGRYGFLIEKEKQVYRYQIYPGSPETYLPTRAVYMV